VLLAAGVKPGGRPPHEHISFINMNALVDRGLVFANWIVAALSSLYVYGMFIHPWFNGGWKNVHAVWQDWQSLNVGILAFTASVIAFNISRYHSIQQRRRELVAARSFLPESLSELTQYFKKCGAILSSAYRVAKRKDRAHDGASDAESPTPPNNHKEIFSRCISLADADLAEHLSYILTCLQIHHSRIAGLVEDQKPNSRTIVTAHQIVTYIFRLGELQALVNNTFAYARGEEEFSVKPLDWESYRTAYANLGMLVHNFDDLEGFTKRALGRRT